MPSLPDMVAELAEHGVRRVHVLGWRDLDDLEAGGSEMHADAFMRRWQEAGLDVLHRTSFASGHPTTSTRHGYAVVRRGGRMSVFPRTALSESTRRTGRFDALVEIWNGVPWMSPIWCRKPRILVYHHVHGPMWDQIFPRPIAAFGRLVETRLAPPFYRSTPTVTLSEDSYDEMRTLGWKADKLTIAPAGVDEFFSPGGARTSHPSVLAVGRLAPVKRFDRLFEQFSITRSLVPTATLTVIGDGPQRAELESWIRMHEADEWITLAGRVSRSDLLAHYRSAWLVTSASLTEGWGLTITEAAGCATPSVVSDVAGHRSSVRDGRTGRLAAVEELGRTLAEVLRDDEARVAMGRAARDWASSLSWDLLARRVLHPLVTEAASSRPSRR